MGLLYLYLTVRTYNLTLLNWLKKYQHYPEKNIQSTEHGKSLKSKIL